MRPNRTVRLAKIYDDGLQFHQIDAGEISTDDYSLSRALALALFEEAADLDGLAYRSRYNNGEICYAIFDRIDSQDFAKESANRFADHRKRVDGLMELYGAVFDTSPPIPNL
ncbi:hypothetical protein SAMCCGM7_pA0023 (plasmid) [Sinorhizobium americanum CCGM7]|nr:hypothetical protein SAMCCGM7_pA0023 [Sinorhizobium americanum CCGM7]